ncbi:hypothetical protein [Aliivibrio fischeri]|uniref:hypothetical protein n=1 Tax=Aliivibrio fischeri TaxID=668 RepID=UPI001BE4AABC|nr:hypothetical protein [Aliivibrio fischeri]
MKYLLLMENIAVTFALFLLPTLPNESLDNDDCIAFLEQHKVGANNIEYPTHVGIEPDKLQLTSP